MSSAITERQTMTITLFYPVFRQAPITQKYGVNPGSYTVGCTPDGSHNGLDFGIPEGTPVYATADGMVTRAGMDASGYGIHVRIEHDGLHQYLWPPAQPGGQDQSDGQGRAADRGEREHR